MTEQTRDLTERTIEAVIEASPIALTAGAVLRIMEANGATVPSRTTVQRILDRMGEDGAIVVMHRTIEKNGHIINAREYSKRAMNLERAPDTKRTQPEHQPHPGPSVPGWWKPEGDTVEHPYTE